jgi:aryl-alcohol dehydrogenase-like predicted oxidoreductase
VSLILSKPPFTSTTQFGELCLTGKYHQGIDKPENRLNQYKSRMNRYLGENSYTATGKYLAVAEKHGLTLTQLALGFINTRPFVTSNIIGATSMEQLKENIDTVNVDMTKDMLKDINEVHEMIPNPAP